MTQKSIEIFVNEIHCKAPKKNFSTNKPGGYNFDDIWSLDILDLKNHGPEHNRKCRYVLFIKDNFSKFGWTVPLKNKSAQTITNSLEIILMSSKRKPNLIKTDRGKEF